MSEIQKLENSIAASEAVVAKAAKVLALYDNPDFKEIIVKGYFEQSAIRLVGLYGDGNQTPEDMRNIESDMSAIGTLRRYLSKYVQEGHVAERALQADKEALIEYLAYEAQAAANGEEIPLSGDADYAGNLGA